MQVAGTNLEAALRNAIAGGYVAEMSGQTYTVTQPIVINVTSTIQGPLGIDLGGATIVSQITNGAPVIQINAGPGVDLRYLTLSNFTIQGNGSEGDGIKIVADGNDRWIYNFDSRTSRFAASVAIGLDVRGSVFEGMVSNSSMIGNRLGGAYFGHSAGGGQLSALRWFGGSIEGNGGAGLFARQRRPRHQRRRRHLRQQQRLRHQCRVGHHVGDGQRVPRQSNQRHLVPELRLLQQQHLHHLRCAGHRPRGILTGSATLIDNSRSVYTGGGTNPTVLANMQGPGRPYMVDDTGKVITGSLLSVSGLGGGNEAQLTVSNPAPPSSLTCRRCCRSAARDGKQHRNRRAGDGATIGPRRRHCGNLSGASFTVTTPIVIYLTERQPVGRSASILAARRSCRR